MTEELKPSPEAKEEMSETNDKAAIKPGEVIHLNPRRNRPDKSKQEALELAKRLIEVLERK